MYGWGNYGMGADRSGPMFTCPTGESVFSAADCPGGAPAASGGSLSAADQMRIELDALWDYARAGQNEPGPTQWLNANAGKVALGVGGLFVIMLLAKAGR